MIHDCVLGRHLERIDRLARLADSEDYKVAQRIAADLSRELSSLNESAPEPVSAEGLPVPADTRLP
jgi:hypothetical protein